MNAAAALPAGASKAALDAALAAGTGTGGSLAIVLAVEGHGYAAAGTFVHVDAAGRRVGWISPGCLEAELETAAVRGQGDGQGELLVLDNRDLGDVFTGGAGCRGRQTVLLLPLAALPGLARLLIDFRHGSDPLALDLDRDDAAYARLRLRVGGRHGDWTLPLRVAADAALPHGWRLCLAPLPRVLVCGGGPESPLLLRMLGESGWRIDLIESRAAWKHLAALAEVHLPRLPEGPAGMAYDAALVMAHHFDLDRSALLALASWPQLPWVGLLGPQQRRADLLATLPADARTRLEGRLESPAGLDLGGRGPAAIALSLAAKLQQLATSAST